MKEGFAMGMMPQMMEEMMKACAERMKEIFTETMISGQDLGLKLLFEEWLNTLEGEVLKFLKEKGTTTPEELSQRLKLSPAATLALVSRLAAKGKIKITGLEVQE